MEILRVFQVFLALGLIGVVLLQRSEGGGLGIGSSGGMGSFMSVARYGQLSDPRVTAILAGLFMLVCLILALMAKPVTAPKSIFDTPAPTAPAPLTQVPTPVARWKRRAHRRAGACSDHSAETPRHLSCRPQRRLPPRQKRRLHQQRNRPKKQRRRRARPQDRTVTQGSLLVTLKAGSVESPKEKAGSPMTRFIFITGGVVPPSARGWLQAALGSLLQTRGFTVRLRQAGPLSQYRSGHDEPDPAGEVFVTDDGAETDSRPWPL